jgi:hypothetical protein
VPHREQQHTTNKLKELAIRYAAAGQIDTMHRKRLVESPKEQLNDLARIPAFANLVRRCFGPDILPSKYTHPNRFAERDIFLNLYIATRNAPDQGPLRATHEPYAHEKHLDSLFWDPATENRKIYILGQVGCGKSTLIDYYLRCFCPSRGARAEDFDQKFILHFDAIGIQDAVEYSYNFFNLAQSMLRFHSEQRDFDIDKAVSRRPYTPSNIREWVWAALEEITRKGAPFKYTVIVIDNLDKTPADVQKRAIRDVDTWLKAPTIRLWRVLIPLWPSTLTKLRNHGFDPMRNITEFPIGSVSMSHLLSFRIEALTAELSRLASGVLPQTALQFVNAIQSLTEDKLLPRITSLSNGDLRRKLSMWEAFLTGEVSYAIWRHHQADPEKRRSFEYELLDGLLRGSHDVFQPDHMRIANIFALSSGTKTCRDLLIGHHALTLLSHNVATRRAFAGDLLRLGYDLEAVDAVERHLQMFNILHEIPTSTGTGLGVEFEIHSEVVNAYLSLCMEPAYVDNVAMVTPVDQNALHRMKKTRGDKAEDFEARAESTLAFIEFLRNNECQFCDRQFLPSQVEPDLFAYTLRVSQLPALWKRIALRYRDRLQGLRESSYLRHVPSAWWKEILQRRILAEAADSAEYLLAIV